MLRIVTDSEGAPAFAIEILPSQQVADGSAYRPPIQGAGKIVESIKGIEQFESEITSACKTVAVSVRKGLSELHPQEFEVTFGLAIGAEGGIPMITNIHGDVNLQIRVLWRQDSPT